MVHLSDPGRPRPLETLRDPDEGIRVGKSEANERWRLDGLVVVADASLVGRDLELDASSRHSAQFQNDVEAARFGELGGHVDHLDLTPTKSERPPRLVERHIKSENELVKVAANQAIDILRGTGRRVQPVLKQRASLQEKHSPTISVDRSLDRRDRHRRRDEPAELAAPGFITDLALCLGNLSVEHLHRHRLLALRCEHTEKSRQA